MRRCQGENRKKHNANIMNHNCHNALPVAMQQMKWPGPAPSPLAHCSSRIHRNYINISTSGGRVGGRVSVTRLKL